MYVHDGSTVRILRIGILFLDWIFIVAALLLTGGGAAAVCRVWLCPSAQRPKAEGLCFDL